MKISENKHISKVYTIWEQSTKHTSLYSKLKPKHISEYHMQNNIIPNFFNRPAITEFIVFIATRHFPLARHLLPCKQSL